MLLRGPRIKLALRAAGVNQLMEQCRCEPLLGRKRRLHGSEEVITDQKALAVPLTKDVGTSSPAAALNLDGFERLVQGRTQPWKAIEAGIVDNAVERVEDHLLLLFVAVGNF